MSSMIEDGKGTGNRAGVDAEFRLLTRAVNTEALLHLTVLGRTFSYSSQVLTLTSGSESVIGFLENNGTQEVVFSSVNVFFGTSTGGANGDCLIKTYQLVTSSTAATPLTALPSRSSVAISSADIVVSAGQEGATQTGGFNLGGVEIAQTKTWHSLVLNSSSAFFLPGGSKMALAVTPPASNTSLIVSFSGLIHINDGSI